MNIYKNITELIGNTPIMELKNYEKHLNAGANILAKLEYLNPAGSVKDRAALYMLKDAENKGMLNGDTVIIEPTSGNTGIGFAAIAASKGYKVMLTMPDTMSVERRNLLKAYGAEIVLTDGKLGMNGAIEKALELNKQIKNSIIPGQFTSPANANAHYKTTGPEIWKDCDGKVDIFVAGVGTGGTITGTGKFLKEQNPNIKIVAVEPQNSPMLSEGKSGAHGLQGIGAGFIPDILDISLIDEIITVTENDAYTASRYVAQNEGILVGISSGAALFAAGKLAERDENKGKNIVVLLPDTGDRYLSTPMFS